MFLTDNQVEKLLQKFEKENTSKEAVMLIKHILELAFNHEQRLLSLERNQDERNRGVSN